MSLLGAAEPDQQPYDEDLSANPFFKVLQKHKLYSSAMDGLWTICVPCAPSLMDFKSFPVEVLRTHLLTTQAGAEVCSLGIFILLFFLCLFNFLFYIFLFLFRT